jgi:hypothetical protein
MIHSSWEYDTAGPGRITGNSRRQHEIRRDQAVAQAQCPSSKRRYKKIGDTTTQPGLNEATGNEKGDHDQPDRAVAETTQRLVNCFILCRHWHFPWLL